MVDSDDDGASGNSDVMVDSDDDGAIGYGDFMAGTPVDIKIYAHSYEFVLDMPGLETADVRVQVKPNNVLIISGERRREEVEGVKYAKMERRLGKMMRKFALPGDANMDKITSGCRAGVLTVVVERLPPAHPMRPTMIEVKREAVHHCGDDRKVVGADDRISLLPNELLLCVLSLLSFKEAVATSILSHRWKYLHTFIAKLDFDGTELLQKANNNRQGFDEVKRKFLRLVDGIVRLNQCSPLEKFRVLFLLKQSDTQHIDRWVRFALSRKVESLELILTEKYSWCNYYDDDEDDDDEDEEDLYTLNKTIFTWEGVTSSNASVYTLNLAPSDVYNLNLKKLSTYGVNVSGEAVEMLLQSCPLMEQVSIVRSEHLLWLKIIKPFPSFKSLEIILCKKLTCVVVRDSNIVTLKYTGHRISFVLQNVPLLTELWTDWMGYDGGDVVRMFSSVLPQLHTFKMRFDLYMPCENDVIKFCSTLHLDVEMSNLKQLVVNIGFGDGDSLLPYLRLIRASPRLERFVIEIPSSRHDKFVEGEVGEISAGRKIPRSYPHLKEVKFVGYCGVSNHFKVLKHFVKNAVALETIVVDPCGLVYPYLDGTWEYLRREFDAVAFERAKALKDSVPFGINVKIL